MADAVSICNLAMAHIGEEATIISLDPPEGSEEAKACAAFYPTAVSTLLDAHDWNFATRRAVLTQYADAERNGWRFAYALPADCIRAIAVRPSERQRFFGYVDSDFEIVARSTGRVLLTDCPSAVLTYVSSEVSTGAYSPSFVDALAWLLAMHLAGERIKGKEGASFAQNCQKQYFAALSQARQNDARQFRSRVDYRPDWIKVR